MPLQSSKVTWLWWIVWNLKSPIKSSLSLFLKTRDGRAAEKNWLDGAINAVLYRREGKRERTLHYCRGDFIMAITISMAFTWTTFKVALYRFPDWSPTFFSEIGTQVVRRVFLVKRFLMFLSYLLLLPTDRAWKTGKAEGSNGKASPKRTSCV